MGWHTAVLTSHSHLKVRSNVLLVVDKFAAHRGELCVRLPVARALARHPIVGEHDDRAVHEQHTARQESVEMRRYKEELLPDCQRAKSTVASAEAKALKVRVSYPPQPGSV